MQLQITRLPAFSIVTGSDTRYGVQAAELRRWLLELGVGDSAIVSVLDTDPNETMTLEVADNAA
jgi:hypothetical protein